MKIALVLVLAIVAVTGLMATHVSAGQLFSDNFSATPAATEWANTGIATVPVPAPIDEDPIYWDDVNENMLFNYSVDAAQEGDEREYLRTLDVDYADHNFVASVELTNGATGSLGSAFFGLGEGVRNLNKAGEPQSGDYVYMRLNGEDFGTHFTVRSGEGSNRHKIEIHIGDSALPAYTTVGVQLVWDALANEATFNIDIDGDGAYDDGSCTTNAYVNMADSAYDMRLFFGGAGGATGDNFSVGQVVPGDANRDGKVNEDDAAILASNWLTESEATWGMGDFNNDGMVNDIDATLLATNWQLSSATSVPEPNVFVLVSAWLLGIFVVARRKKK